MKKKKNTDKEVDEENEKKVTRRTLRLEARVTEAGIYPSGRACQDLWLIHERLCAPHRLGQHPRQRLSDREVKPCVV